MSASLWHRLYHGQTSYRFVGPWKKWATISGAVLVAGMLSMVFQGLNYGIDFRGGTSWEVRAPGVSVAAARDALRPQGLADSKVQVLGADLLRVQAGNLEPADAQAVTGVMADLGRVSEDEVSISEVGPAWGADVTRKAVQALVVFFLLIAAYISWRFEWRMAIAALAAVVHDIGVTVGVYSISRFEVTPATVVAFLTILGFSLYDTIVVFDKVEENTKNLAGSGKVTYSDVVDLSMNQVLMRSLNTSLVAILPIVSVLVVGVGILGATVLKDFGLALLVGLLTGAYSSIFVAAPLLAMLKEREPRYAGIRQRLAKGGGGLLTPSGPRSGAPSASASIASGGGGDRHEDWDARDDAGAEDDGAEDDGASSAAGGAGVTVGPASTRTAQPGVPAASRPSGGTGGVTPRPRKKGKRR
ncbi:MAG: protein translocase subunit SecF [Acidimicrobiales bacterium]